MNCHTFGCPELPPGSHACHCAQCHRTFSNLTLFDRHQETDYGHDPAISCKAPGALGLVRASNGTWWTPEGLTALTEKLGKMAAGRVAA